MHLMKAMSPFVHVIEHGQLDKTQPDQEQGRSGLQIELITDGATRAVHIQNQLSDRRIVFTGLSKKTHETACPKSYIGRSSDTIFCQRIVLSLVLIPATATLVQ